MAKLVPGNDDNCGNGCGNHAVAAEEEEGGCGSSNGRTAGGEMASMEAQLAQNEKAAENGLEVEITAATSKGLLNGTNDRASSEDTTLVSSKKGRGGKGKPQTSRKAAPRQVMGQCKRCGYLSSQEICKACVLLEGLNKNRPKNQIEVSGHVEEATNELDLVTTGLRQIRLEGI